MKKLFLICTLLASFILSSYSANPRREKNFEEISKENLWKKINELNIQHPEIVFAQAILETGTFKSTVFKKYNNLFGMKMPSRRPTVAQKPERKGGYAKYDNWQQSVEDYKMYQAYLFRKGELDKAKYLNYLDRVYCESAGYSTKLKNIINRHQQIFNS